MLLLRSACIHTDLSNACRVVPPGAMSPLSAAAAAAAAAGRVALSGSGVSGVLLASNLNDEVGSIAIAALKPVGVAGVCVGGCVLCTSRTIAP